MNWPRIFSAVALAASLVAIGSVIWLSGSQGSSALHRFQGTCEASIVIQLKEFERVVSNPIVPRPSTVDDYLHYQEPDLHFYVTMLRSSKLCSRLAASFSPEEFRLIFGKSFLQTGLTTFNGVQVDESDVGPKLIVISTKHANPAAARLIVEHHYSELIKHYRETDVSANGYAMRYLRERRIELVGQLQKAETQLEGARHSQDTKFIREAEETVRTSREWVRTIEERIASMATSEITTPDFPFHIVEARIVSGPFWNRITTDFTADTQRLIER